MSRIKKILISLLGLAALAGGTVYHLHRRPLPPLSGEYQAAGLSAPVEIVRDSWGTPHIFAANRQDAYFALGYAVAQDRLFQLHLVKHLTQGRLAELVGPPGLELDRLHRTLDLHGNGIRMLERSSQDTRASIRSYVSGINAWLENPDMKPPVEFLLLGTSPEPFREDDFVGLIGMMTWALNPGWFFDRIYERVQTAVGPERAAELFPLSRGGPRPVFLPQTVFRFPLLDNAQAAAQALGMSFQAGASNNWVVSPEKTASGAALLANDPHLDHALPSLWYQAHISAGGLDAAGMTMPGFPFVVIGRNRDIAWGMTNVMADASDFFLERLNPENQGQVMHQGRWVPLETREETISIKGGGEERLVIRTTPHGPLIGELFQGLGQAAEMQPVSLQWVLEKSTQTSELDAFNMLNHARDWDEFRRACSRFGAVSNNIAYADRQGHIGMQASGALVQLPPDDTGTRYRRGWDGSDEWQGFHPFSFNPRRFDPPGGWAASANNPLLSGGNEYISAYWEPQDRFDMIVSELSRAGNANRPEKGFTAEDMRQLQNNISWPLGLRLSAEVAAIHRLNPPGGEAARLALPLLEGWDGRMDAASPAAAIMAVFYRHLFHTLFDDELGGELAADIRKKDNVSALMIRQVLDEGPAWWFDRQDTPGQESREDIMRITFRAATEELEAALGRDPAKWEYGRIHSLEFTHPLGRVKALAPYFNLGPFPMAGHAQTVAKAQTHDGETGVYHGPGMRMIVDWSQPDRAWTVITNGQSGIRASEFYDNMTQYWLQGRHVPLYMEREDIEKNQVGTLVLRP